jgi:hypothetical protein
MPIFGITASSNMSIKLTDFYQIATTTVGAGTASEIVFSSIPSDYTHLQIRCIARNTVTSGNLRLQFNSDSGTNYSAHQLYADGASVASYSGTNVAYIEASNMPSTANIFSAHIIDILDYANTNKFKTTRTLHGYDLNGSGLIQYFSGNWRSTSAISTIRLFPGNNALAQYSSFALYGIKG